MLNYYQSIIIFSAVSSYATSDIKTMMSSSAFCLFPMFSIVLPFSLLSKKFGFFYINEVTVLPIKQLELNPQSDVSIIHIGLLGYISLAFVLFIPLVFCIVLCFKNSYSEKATKVMEAIKSLAIWHINSSGLTGVTTIALFAFIRLIQTYSKATISLAILYFCVFALYLSLILLLSFVFYYKNWNEITSNEENNKTKSQILFKGLKTNLSSLLYYHWMHYFRAAQLAVLVVCKFISAKFTSYTQDSEEKLYPAEIVIICLHSLLFVTQLSWMVYLGKVRPWRSCEINKVDFIGQLFLIAYMIQFFIFGNRLADWTLTRNTFAVLCFIPFSFIIVLSYNLMTFCIFNKCRDKRTGLRGSDEMEQEDAKYRVILDE